MYSSDLPLDAFDLSVETVRGRFSWAERRGEPRWLWPGVSLEAWSEALIAIEGVLRGVFAGTAPPHLDCEPGALGIAAYTSGTGPLLACWLERDRFVAPAEVGGVLAYQLRHNRLRMERLTQRAVALVERFTRHGVPVAVIKGMHSAHGYFPEPGTRPVSDIDLVIAPRDLAVARLLLIQSGYARGRSLAGPPAQEEWRPVAQREVPRTLAFVHFDDPWSIDLQVSHDRRFGSGGRIAYVDRALPAPPWPSWRPAPAASVLPQPWQLLGLALHASANWENLSMLRLAEIAFIAHRDAIDWDAFLRASERVGSPGLVYPALCQCARLAPEIVPTGVLERCRQATPRAAREVIESLRPATVQRLVALRRREKFLWAPTLLAQASQLFAELVPRESASLGDFARIYRRRAWKFARRTVLR
jgi:hypothetical protein